MAHQQRVEGTAGKVAATASQTLQTGRQKVAEYGATSQQVVKGNLETLWDYSVYVVQMAYQYMNAMKPLKVAVYMCGFLSAVPLAIFIGFLAITFAFFVGSAGVVVTLLESGAFLVGGAVVTPVLFCSGFVTLFVVGGYLLAWLTARAFARTWNWISTILGKGVEEIEEGVEAVERGARRGLHAGEAREG